MVEDKSIRTILVTGANGQLANEIRAIAPAYPGFKFVFASREDLQIENEKAIEKVFQDQSIHYCINCAAYTAVDKAEVEKEQAFLINADAVGNLATICKKYQAQFIHISTDYVYDGSKGTPLKETDAVGPINVYGKSKLKGEELAMVRNPASIIIRTSWVHSSYGSNFVKAMLRLFKEKEELKIVSDQTGSPTYAADLAEVLLQFIKKMESGLSFSGIYNFSNSGTTNWYEFAQAIKEISNSTCNILPSSSATYITPAERPLYSVLDTSKIKKALQIEIPDWKDSLKKCMAKLI